MSESLRTPLFLLAATLLAVAVLVELGSPLVDRLSSRFGVPAADVNAGLASARRLVPQLAAMPEDEVAARVGGRAERPPGRAIAALAWLDGLVLFTVALIGASLLVPERVHGRLQGVVTLVVSLVALLAAIVQVFAAIAALLLMVMLLLAIPFGTIAYLIAYGSFDRGLASLVLSLTMLLKIGFAAGLVFAHPGFVKMKGLVLIVVTALVASVIISTLHGFVPGILVSITDAVAAIVVGVLAALWALFLLVGSIPSIVKSIKLRA